jgi:hypothetical protein
MLAAATLLGACGGSDNTGGGATCTPGQTTTVTITATGISPKAVCVRPSTAPTNGIVRFTNNSGAARTIAHSGTTCPELDVGPIANGATMDSQPLTTETVCQFHDAGAPTDTAFQGTVAVTTGTVGGPGY